MRFLIDNALSPSIAEGLRQVGHDANLPALEEPLAAGAIAVIEDRRIRLRNLPLP